jgi:hypothetical protein
MNPIHEYDGQASQRASAGGSRRPSSRGKGRQSASATRAALTQDR